jgi:hypothetical protein
VRRERGGSRRDPQPGPAFTKEEQMHRALGTAFVLLAAVAVTAGSTAWADLTTTVTFDPYDVSVDVGDEYDVVRVEGCRFDLDPGKPMLPVKTLHFSIPAGMKAVGVEVRALEQMELGTDFVITPAQPPVRLGQETPPEPVPADAVIYDSAEPFPGKVAELIDVGNMGGYAVAGVRVHPLEYQPRAQRLLLNRRFELTLVLETSGESAVAIAGRRDEAEAAVARRVRSLVVNPEDVDANCGPRLRGARDDTVEYAIITGASYVDEFQPLADWKTKKGVPTEIFTTDWIYTNYSGSDNPMEIRNFIIDYEANHGLVYVLLGGDVDVVPARVAWDELGYDGIRADLYYSDTDGTWNADGDSYYGEHPEDNVDMYGDVYVGRAPVNSSSEATNFVDQVLTYEGADAGGTLPTDFQENMLFLAEVLWGPPEYPYTDGGIAKDMIDDDYVPSLFDPITKLYEDDGNLGYTAAMNAMNAGPGITNHCGHCNYNVMSINPDALYNDDMDDLTNGSRQGIFYTIGCWAAAFDYDNIAEHYVNNPNGGGVAFVGNSRYGWGCPGYPGECVSDLYDQQFFRALFTSQLRNIGITHADAKDYYVPDAKADEYMRYGLYELNVLGDPEMPIWTSSPATLVATHPTTVPMETSSFLVEVTSGGSDVAGARVCVWKGTEIYEVGTTNASGAVTLSITPLTEGPMSVTVTKEDYLPYEGEATAEDSGPQLLFITHTPLGDTSDPNNPYEVVATITTVEAPLNPDSTLVMWRAGGGSFTGVVMTATGTPDEYHGYIPAQDCGMQVDYYVLAIDTNSNSETHPDYAPGVFHSFAVNYTVDFEDDLEIDRGWTVGAPDDDATTGVWERCDPEGTEAQPENDHTPTPGVNAYITQCAAGSSQGSYDIDGGKTTLFSPVFDLSGYSGATVSYYRWYSNDTGSSPGEDYWVVEVTDDDWATSATLENTNATDRSWQQMQFALESYIDMTDQVQFRFIASDEGSGSIVEAGVDDFSILICPAGSDIEPPEVTVVAPNGGEQLIGTTQSEISWTSSDNVGVTATTILLSTDGGATYPDTLASGSLSSPWTWDVPDVSEPDCRIKVVCFDAELNEGSDVSDADFEILSLTGVGEFAGVPRELMLAANRPNPFSRGTEIRFGLPEAARISLKVYNVEGRVVATLADGQYPRGYHRVSWTGRDSKGVSVATGVYFYRLQTENKVLTRKMMMLK